MPAALQAFAQQALQQALAEPGAISRALGEWLTEPKPQVWFDGRHGAALGANDGLALDRRTRMAYDAQQVFINGESFRAGGSDARLMRRLADRRALAPAEVRRLSADARALIAEWLQAGWLHARREPPPR